MSFVVDASVLVAAVADAGPFGTWAIGILSDSEPIAPHLAPVEAVNILRSLERARKLTSAEAEAALTDLMSLDLVLVPFEPFYPRVWELHRNVSAYDAWYVAVAEAFDLPLATLDRALSRATGVSCQFTMPA